MTELWLSLAGLFVLGGAIALFCFVGCESTSVNPALPSALPYHEVVGGHPDLVAYWRLGEPSPQKGSTAADEKKGHPGSYQAEPFADDLLVKSPAATGLLDAGPPSLIESDAAATSVRVNGAWVAVSHTPALNPQRFTLEAWVHPQWPSGEKDRFRCVLASREVSGVPLRGYMLYTGPKLDEPVDLNARWQVWVGDGTGPRWVVGPQVVLNSTTHLVATYDGTTLRLYVNGTLSGSGIVPYVPTDHSGGVPLYIGAGAPEGMPGPRFPFHGRLQEVALYSQALAPDEIQHHKTLAQAS